MSDTTALELYSFITHICKLLKNFDFPEAEQPLGLFSLKIFHGFVIWEDRTNCLPCVLFGNKYVGKYFKNSYQNW